MSIQTFKKMMTGSVILVSTVLLTACASTSATTVSEGHHSDSVRSSRKSDVKVPTRTSNVTTVAPATTSFSSDQSSLAVTGTSSSASETSAVSDSDTTSSNVSTASTSSAQTSSVQSSVVPSSSVQENSIQGSSVQSGSVQSSSVKGNATQTSLSKVASGTVATSGQQDSSRVANSQQVSQVTGNANGQSSVSPVSKTSGETTQQPVSNSNSTTKGSVTTATSANGVLSNFRSQMGYNETNGSRQYTVINNGNGTYQIDVRTQAPDANISNLAGVYTYTPANKEVTTVFSGADAGNGGANTVNTPTTDNSTSTTQSNH
ncbi:MULTISPECIES: hypothetical protein [Furfurilactobacillus]|uniref:Uncharacterized protein n=1 Tax=Furfurilactobacillus rossiae TaxID=231049 RepID=A0A7C9IUN8_9LACO|nr:hypothetical protein [Furfurilactobacillus milii]MYV06176.1 hypothetical protein [Furfurilactobacillus milii]